MNETAPLFRPFRALGYVSDDVPFAVQRRGKETYVTVSVGRAWHIYDAGRMLLKLIGPQLPAEVNGLAVRGDLTFAALRDGSVSVCRRVQALPVLPAHPGARIVHMMVIGDYLLTLGSDRRLLAWDVSGKEPGAGGPDVEVLLEEGFEPSCMAHPDTYVNKVVLGARDGRMQLWNFVSGKRVYEFASLGSAVRCIAPSPALDTVGVGLADGRCVVVNLRFDEVIMTLENAAGGGAEADRLLGHKGVGARGFGPGAAAAGRAVTALSFRTGPGPALLAAGGGAGVVTLWDLDERRLRGVIREAHDGTLLCLHFFPGEPVLMSAATDNALKHWIFDNADGSHRLLRFRAGHSAPPSVVRHYGDGTRLLSAGHDRSFRLFSAIQDQQSRELSQGHVGRRAKRLRVKEEELKLPRVVALDAAQVRERDWANVVTAHEGDSRAYTWRLRDGCLGDWVLVPPRDRDDPVPNAPVTAVCLSSCGNFALVGSAAGRVDRYNMQSGLHRGAYQRGKGLYGKDAGLKSFVDSGETPETNAHSGAVTGVSSDACNQYAVSCSTDGYLRVWGFKSRRLIAEAHVGVRVLRMAHHRHSALVALAGEDHGITVWDAVACRIVRRFRGHTDRVTDMAFSSDARWLLSAAMDGHVRAWDVPNSRCLQVMVLGAPVTSLSLSPTMDLLATTHANRRGIYLWSNQALFGNPANLRAGSERPVRCGLPAPGADVEVAESSSDAGDESDETDRSDEEEDTEMGAEAEAGQRVDPATGTPLPVAPELVTTSLLPRAQWASLADLAAIRERSKPVQPPRKPAQAPFFLPTASGAAMGRNPVFDLEGGGEREGESGSESGDEDAAGGPGSRILRTNARGGDSDFIALLRRCERSGDFTSAVAAVRSMKPSALDAEIRALEVPDEAAATAEEVGRVAALLSFAEAELRAKRNFDAVNAVLRVVLDAHAGLIQAHGALRRRARVVRGELGRGWGRVGGLLHEVGCLAGFLGELHGEA